MTCPICGSSDTFSWLSAPDRYHGRHQVYHLVRCGSCKVVWLSNPPSPADLAAHYGADYEKLIGGAGENSPGRWKDRRHVISRHLQGGALLDLGCGSGAFLKSLVGSQWKLYGVEFSPDAARRASQEAGVQVFVGDVLSAPFEEKSFDIVTCFDVLEHMYEPQEVLRAVWKWLKPGGLFYVLVPNIDSAEARVFRSYWYGLELPRHVFHYCPHSLAVLAQRTGFETISLQTQANDSLLYSLGYISDNIRDRLGLQVRATAKEKPLRLLGRVLTSAFNRIARPIVMACLRTRGPGESIHALFRRPRE